MGNEVLHLDRVNHEFICNIRGDQSTINITVLHLLKYQRQLWIIFYSSFNPTQLLLLEKIYTTGTLRHKRGGPSDLLIFKRKIEENITIVLEKKMKHEC